MEIIRHPELAADIRETAAYYAGRSHLVSWIVAVFFLQRWKRRSQKVASGQFEKRSL